MHELPDRKIDWDAYYRMLYRCVACGKDVNECGCSEEQIKEAYAALYREAQKRQLEEVIDEDCPF